MNRDRDLRRLEIERDQVVELIDIDKSIALLGKSKERVESQIEYEAARAKAVRAEEQVATARDAEIANRRREIELLLAQKDAEEQRIVVDRIRAAVEAEAQRLLNEAENVLTAQARLSVFRRNLLGKVEGIVRESVRPMEKIDGINILHVDGLGGAGGSGRNMTDEVIDSALRYRVQAPLIDSLLGDIGMEGGSLSKMGGLIREARDLDSIRRSAQAEEKDAGADEKKSKD